MSVPQIINNEGNNNTIIHCNGMLVEEVERLAKLLDHNRITVETRDEINKAIQEYMKQIRALLIVID